MHYIDNFNSFHINNYHGMFTVDWSKKQVKHFIESADDLIDKGKIIKSDKTSTVSKTSFNNTEIVIKRYNNKGLIYSLRNSLRKSRAKKSWIKSHILLDIGIYTPSAMAYIIEKRNGLYFRSYFVMEYCPLPTLHSVIMKKTSRQEWQKITKDIKSMLDNLAENNITHGDLKHSNVLVQENGIGVLDLDAMVIHNNPFTFKIKRRKDERSFNNRLMIEPLDYIERKK